MDLVEVLAVVLDLEMAQEEVQHKVQELGLLDLEMLEELQIVAALQVVEVQGEQEALQRRLQYRWWCGRSRKSKQLLWIICNICYWRNWT